MTTTKPKPKPKATPKLLHPALTPERLKEMRNLARKIDREEKPAMMKHGKRVTDQYAKMIAILPAMRAEREAQGLSLADVAAKVGGRRENIARIERGHGVNPTLRTLFRYARALGKELEIKLVDPK